MDKSEDRMTKEKEEKNTGKDLFVGFDIGSSFVHYAVLNDKKEKVYAPNPIMHFANPIAAVREAWDDIVSNCGADRIRNTAFTGSGAESFPEVMSQITYVYDSVAIPKGVEMTVPNALFVFHIGAKDPYFFHLKEIGGKRIIQDWKPAPSVAAARAL